ncbi:HAMP domain-containing histidine kinase [Lentibacillus cibarius]|uniref:histidine kinase n=1 Tax=Lentibacillus cibarius TaxID=2583219 RepID=A0A549YJT5_9BACI|nr:HAMP domain-containing sensor histidine kinase [Lentibacillus cibarius]TRM12139.1 HAMP domain-containing histidine kinase [Lentibacillus cibarius]
MNKIVLKLGGAIMTLFLVVLLPLGYITNEIFTNFYYSHAQKEVGELSKKYAKAINSLENEETINMFKVLSGLTNNDILILNANGNVVASSGIKTANLSDEEMNQLLAGQPVVKRFRGSKDKGSYLGSGHPIVQSGSYKGAFFVLTSISDIQEPVKKIRDLLTLSAVGALFVALGFTFLMARKMSNPLLEMEQATREIAKGNLHVRVDIPSKDEVGSLGTAINDLALETNRYRSNRREFFANISHELRTPITYLKGYAEILKKDLYQTEEERQHYLTIMEDESDRLTRLINDLFDLSKMEEGKIDLQMDVIDLTGVLEVALKKAKIELDKKGLTLNSRIDKDVPLVKADAIRLEQVFTNLLGNSIQYTKKGSINVQVYSKRNEVHVIIEDSGVGIHEEDIPLVFERFYRVEKSRSRELGGTGLGLSIVKNLVELQNGTISVSSQLGQGTRFQLSFPIAKEVEA